MWKKVEASLEEIADVKSCVRASPLLSFQDESGLYSHIIADAVSFKFIIKMFDYRLEMSDYRLGYNFYAFLPEEVFEQMRTFLPFMDQIDDADKVNDTGLVLVHTETKKITEKSIKQGIMDILGYKYDTTWSNLLDHIRMLKIESDKIPSVTYICSSYSKEGVGLHIVPDCHGRDYSQCSSCARKIEGT
jgi:hypothetical protein